MGKHLSKHPPQAAADARRRSSTPPALDMVTLRRKSEEFERQLEQDMLVTRRYNDLKQNSSRKDLRRSCGTATPSPKTASSPRSFSSVMKDDPDCAVVELLFVVMETLHLNDVIIIKPVVSSHDNRESPHPFLLCVEGEHYFPVTTHRSAATGKWQASVTIKL
jgi:hypothetical protein